MFCIAMKSQGECVKHFPRTCIPDNSSPAPLRIGARSGFISGTQTSAQRNHNPQENTGRGWYENRVSGLYVKEPLAGGWENSSLPPRQRRDIKGWPGGG